MVLNEEEKTMLFKKLEDIEMALVGNEKLGVEGLVRRVDRHEEKLDEYESMKQKGVGMVAAFTAFISFLGISLWELIKHFSK